VFDLSGRVALVTGAGQNVGLGIATLLARQGAAVAVNDLLGERAREGAERIARAGGKALAAAFDVTDAAAVREGVARTAASLGPVDILVNNAGVPPGMRPLPFRETDEAEWRRYIDLNLYGVIHCSKAVVDGMCERGFGRVITISSGAGQVGLPIGVAAYGAGKGGALSFMRHLAIELAGQGVTANSLALGLMESAAAGDQPELARELARTVPVGRMGTPEDVAAAVLWLASDEASWVTGQTIGLNGGSVTS
jgi:NAD(P)-dependent dehydrogenase (short-subunit alcohol dehydrogenase family)